MKKLTRSRDNRIIAGVCGGIGAYLDVDPTVIRVIWAVLTIVSIGAGILAYIVAWLIIPEEESKESGTKAAASETPASGEKNL